MEEKEERKGVCPQNNNKEEAGMFRFKLPGRIEESLVFGDSSYLFSHPQPQYWVRKPDSDQARESELCQNALDVDTLKNAQ